MSRRIGFKLLDEQYEAVARYVAEKKRWRTLGDFARYCVFKEMDVNKAGAHRKAKGAARARLSAGQSARERKPPQPRQEGLQRTQTAYRMISRPWVGG